VRPWTLPPQRQSHLNKPAETARFQLYVWPQRLLVLAPAHASARHRHHAVQLAFGLDGPVTFETAQAGLVRADLLLIPPDTLHGHPAFGPWAGLYLDAESADWRQLSGGEGDGPVALPLDDRLRALAHAAAAGDVGAARSVVDGIVGTPVSRVHGDALVSRACTLVRAQLAEPVRLASLARAVHCSPSRLAHRFREATGVPLRRYVLWCRLRGAVEAAMRGSSLTEAAHAAGFADAAHLSRTFRATFGIVPSFLFARGRVNVTFCEAP